MKATNMTSIALLYVHAQTWLGCDGSSSERLRSGSSPLSYSGQELIYPIIHWGNIGRQQYCTWQWLGVLTPQFHSKVLSAKQVGSGDHLYSLWYDPVMDWTHNPTSLWVDSLPLHQLSGIWKTCGMMCFAFCELSECLWNFNYWVTPVDSPGPCLFPRQASRVDCLVQIKYLRKEGKKNMWIPTHVVYELLTFGGRNTRSVSQWSCSLCCLSASASAEHLLTVIWRLRVFLRTPALFFFSLCLSLLPCFCYEFPSCSLACLRPRSLSCATCAVLMHNLFSK